MTSEWQKQIPSLRSTPASKDRSPGTPGCGMTNERSLATGETLARHWEMTLKRQPLVGESVRLEF
jgi:hypothetical protein